MLKPGIITSALLAFCSIASAQNAYTGHVQRLILMPPGTDQCPPACPATAPTGPNGLQTVCITNQGGCEVLEVKIDHDYRGTSQGQLKEFRQRIGEWGPRFPVTGQQILLVENGGHVTWSPVTEVNGKLFVEARRMPNIDGVQTSSEDGRKLITLEDVLSRVGVTH